MIHESGDSLRRTESDGVAEPRRRYPVHPVSCVAFSSMFLSRLFPALFRIA